MHVLYNVLLVTEEQKIGYISQYIIEISDISRYRYDFANQKSVGQKIDKITDISMKYRKLFRQNIDSVPHARMGWKFWKNIDKYRRYISKIPKISKIYWRYFQNIDVHLTS